MLLKYKWKFRKLLEIQQITEATNVTVSANNSKDETIYITFVDGATGTQGVETDTGLTYNPSSEILYLVFTGNLTGNVTGNTSGSSGRQVITAICNCYRK